MKRRFFFDLIRITEPLRYDGDVVGGITLSSNEEAIFSRLQASMLFVLLNSVLATISIAWVVWFVLRNRLNRPLAALTGAVQNLDFHNLQAVAFNVGVQEPNELKLLEDAFNDMVENLRIARGRLTQARIEQRRILANVREGLFLLHCKDDTHIVGAEYSQALEDIFEIDFFAGVDFLALFPETLPVNTGRAVSSFLDLMFRGELNEEMLSGLNPLHAISLQFPSGTSRHLDFVFRQIHEEGRVAALLVGVHDVTESVLLSKKVGEIESKSSDLRELLFNILHLDPEFLSDFIADFEVELHTMALVLDAADKNDLFQRLYRSVHTIKGNASLMNMNVIAQKAHAFEEDLEVFRVSQDRKMLDAHFGEMQNLLYELKNLIERLTDFYERMKESGQLSGVSLIKTLQRTIVEQGKKFDKDIQFNNSDFALKLFPDRYRKVVTEVLLQLVRNSLVHGIETPAERLSVGKSQTGTIWLSASVDPENFMFRIGDDGRGIQLQELRKRALFIGVRSKEQLDALSEEETLALIFEARISTAQKTDLIAGRGMGMELVRVKLEDLGGSIKVRSVQGQFSEFVVHLPL